jgi:hypothetical protein
VSTLKGQSHIPNERATNMLSSDLTVQNIAVGVLMRDPSIVNAPALGPYRMTVDGHTYIKVDNLDAQTEVIDLLYSRYGVDVQNWEDQLDYGMNDGTIVAVR